MFYQNPKFIALATLLYFGAVIKISLMYQNSKYGTWRRVKERFNHPYLQLTQNVDENAAVEGRLTIHSRDEMGDLLER